MSTVRTRIPPSPTGRFHIGTARTALFNYLYAKKHGGEFLFRIEDTDRERSRSEFENDIIESLAWLGLAYDGEIVRQSERLPRHTELLKRLVAEDRAYVSKEPSSKDPSQEVEVVRLRNEGRSITFHDEIRGDITFDTTELGDFVIGRSIGDPLYHFAVVVDDADMEVTHVIRGEDHISNTPRQILIQESLGLARPVYAHLPLILASDRSKMSKRHGAVSLLEYRQDGFIPEGIINYLALLGWNPGDEREYFSLSELVDAFDLSRVHKSGAVFDTVKFLSVNQHWLRQKTNDAFLAESDLTLSDQLAPKIVPLLKERAHTYREARDAYATEFAFLTQTPALDLAVLSSKEIVPGSSKEHLQKAKEFIALLPKEPAAESVKEAVMPLADAIMKEDGGRGALLWPLRYALTGQERSPDPFTVVSLLGVDEGLNRIQAALDILAQ